MNDLTRVTVTYSAYLGVHGECRLCIAGLSPDEIAEQVAIAASADPTWFTVGDVDYIKDGDHWVVAS